MTEDECQKKIHEVAEAMYYDGIMVGFYVFASAICWVGILLSFADSRMELETVVYSVRGVIAAVLLHRFSQLRVRAQDAWSAKNDQILKLKDALSKHQSRAATAKQS